MPSRLASFALVLLLSSLWVYQPACAQNGVEDLMVRVSGIRSPWYEPTVEAELVKIINRSHNLRAIPVSSATAENVRFPRAYYNLDSLLDWCREAACRYLIVIHVERIDLERQKDFHVPLVFHKYTTVGVIDAEVRLLDVNRKRFLLAESVRVEEKGPRVFQATMDDEVNDPDLHLTAPAKIRFFKNLETAFCQELVERIGHNMRIRF